VTDALPPEQPASRLSETIAWVRRWGVSIASLCSGLLTLFVFRRGLPHVRWIVGYLLLLWLLFALLTQMRRALEERGHRFVISATDYTIQTLYHGLLLFVIPAYYASTTLSSVNAAFLGVLIVLMIFATFDPWYQAVIHPRPWLGLAFFVISIFAALNVALPLVGVPPHMALLLAAWASTVALAPELRRATGWRWRRSFAVTAVAGLAVAMLAFLGRVAIPPAPLALARATFARGVAGFEPQGAIDSRISATELRESGGLVAYTAVYAPAGLSQPITHVWRHDGRIIDVVTLSPILGGRHEGYRTFSRKTGLPNNLAGRWSVDVRTTSGQLIGRLAMSVTP
jgi:hypothetical protein